MEAITEGQYLDAIKIVRNYLRQVSEEIEVLDTDTLEIPKEVRNITINDKLSTRTLNGINMCYSNKFGIPDDRSVEGRFKIRFEAKIQGLMRLNTQDLMMTRNFGKKGVHEINELLEKYDLQLK